MSKITKTTVLFIITALSSLIIPIIGRWYEIQTNIVPIVFYIVCANGGLAMIILNLYSIWNNDKE